MKPILLNTDMVRGLLNGTKTVTRRVVKGYALDHLELDTDGSIIGVYNQDEGRVFPMMDYAPYRPGDILYVRETWCDPSGTGYPFLYKADMPMHWDAEDTETGVPVDLKAEDYKWCPSIHMPREAARIFLRVTDVRVERLQDIDNAGARAEGCDGRCEGPQDGALSDCQKVYDFSVERFSTVWNSTIKPADRALYGWEANPYVWVIGFDRCEKPE